MTDAFESHATVPLEKLQRASAIRVEVNRKGVMVVLSDQKDESGQCTIHAISDLCPHHRAPMYNGDCHDGCWVCPWHGAAFDLKTGQVQSGPASRGLSVYAVHVEGETVHIGQKLNDPEEEALDKHKF